MLWLLLIVLLVLGFPMMLLFAALSVSLWLVGAVLGLVWAVLTFLLHDAAIALLVVAALYLGYRMGQKRQVEQRQAGQRRIP